MMRDFSPGAKELLMQYVDDVIASGVWETIENGKVEFNQAGQDWLSKLGISDYLDNMEEYYQNIISKNSTTKEEIEQIFSDVQQVDTRYIGTVAGLVKAGLYEVTVPLGVDMMATYCVSVKGTTNFENQSIVGLTIEQQKIVLQSFKVSNRILNDKYSESGNISIEPGGKIILGETITTGNTEVSLEQGVSLENTSVKYEVETALDDNLKVASSIEIEKSNNTDMPEWEAVDIPVEEATYSYESSYNESWMPDWEMVNEFMEGVTVVLRAVGEALICVVFVMMMLALI